MAEQHSIRSLTRRIPSGQPIIFDEVAQTVIAPWDSLRDNPSDDVVANVSVIYPETNFRVWRERSILQGILP